MNDRSRPATGYPAPPNGYPPPPPPGGAAPYSYSGQPPPPYPNYNNPYYSSQHPNPFHRTTFFRRFFAGVISVFIILGAILLITWLVLRPRAPSFRLNSLSLSQFSANASSSELSANWDLKFAVSNPNHKLHIYYTNIDCFIFYKSNKLAENELPPFDQGTKSEGSVSAKLVADSAYVGGKLIGDINGDRSHGSVKFDVSVVALARFKAGVWRDRRRWVRVLCRDTVVGVSANGSNGTLVGGPRRCRVGL